MKAITITPDKKINEIREEFTTLFPYLKIEFCLIPHSGKQGTIKKHLVTGNKKLKEISTKVKSGKIDLSNGITVTELENFFQTEIGVPVQVFRKSGSSWLETTATDNWTLKKQNEMGELLSVKEKLRSFEEFDNDVTK